jgi:hypothetical protein
MEIFMKTWQNRILVSTLCGGSAIGLVAAAGCESKNPTTTNDAGAQPESGPGCMAGTVMCVVEDAAPQIDGTKPIPVQDCMAASARAILTIEQQVGMLGQMSASDPTVKAVAKQMTDDFTAALAELDARSPGLGINKMADCSDKEFATGLVQPALTQLQALTGPAFDQQFVSLEGAALQQVLDFYNSELIANANSGTFKTILRNERWRFAADGGVAVLKPFAPTPRARCLCRRMAPAKPVSGSSPRC